MTDKERSKTGVYKLSEKQKAALQVWIDHHYEKKEGVSTPAPLGVETRKPVISENHKGGGCLRLSDGSLWTIHPEDTPISQGWITPAEILISAPKKGDYPVELVNTLTGSSIRAKKESSL